jgi:hypothetical protein
MRPWRYNEAVPETFPSENGTCQQKAFDNGEMMWKTWRRL